MLFTATSAGFPLSPGAYSAKFTRVVPHEDDGSSSYGPAVMVNFQVLQGNFAGQEVGAICSTKFSEISNLGKFAAAISGQPIQVGQQFDFTAFAGTQGQIIVGPNSKGTVTITSFARDTPQQGGTLPPAAQPSAPSQAQQSPAGVPQPTVSPPPPPLPAE